MAAPRLPFLWPMLFRATEAAVPVSRSAVRRRALHSTYRRRQKEHTVSARYGSANPPPPHLGGGKGLPPATQGSDKQQAKALPKIGEKLQKEGEHENEEEIERLEAEEKQMEPATVEAAVQISSTNPLLDSAEELPPADPPKNLNHPAEHPLDALLEGVPESPKDHKQPESEQTPPKEDPSPASQPMHPPHIDAPRYIHHFDTFGLVKRLQDGGWSEIQAVSTMKSMRLLLADNLDVAKDALVSKSNVENETYLFRAACSELRTEVTTRRKAEQEKMRTERTQLQHEVDILGQRLGQESGSMKDELRGMFDDRRMAVRNEQRAMESKVQELNYKITVNLQADSKSDVEGLRWVMTRRVIMTLGLIVMMVVCSLKLYSNAVHEKELDERRRANMRSSGSQTEVSGSGNGNAGGDGSPKRDSPNAGPLGQGEVLVRQGDGLSFVSLG